MAAQEPNSTSKPESAALAMEEEAAGSEGSGSDTWNLLPAESGTPVAEEEEEGMMQGDKEDEGKQVEGEKDEGDEGQQKEGEEEKDGKGHQKDSEEDEEVEAKHEEGEEDGGKEAERNKKTLAEAIEWRKHWQHQVQEAEARMQDAKEEAAMWQERAAEERKMRVKAEADSAIWENKAGREEGLRKNAEREVADLQRKAKNEEAWRCRWEEKAVAEEKLSERYEQKAKSEESQHAHWRRKAEEQACLLEEQGKLLEQEVGLRLKAEAEAPELRSKAQREESCRARAEKESEQWKQKAEEQETFKNDCERKAKAEQSLRKEWQEKALQREQDMEARFLEQFEDKLKEKDAQFAEAKAAEDELRNRAEHLEEEVMQVKKQVDETEGLRKESEEKAEARIKEIQDNVIAASVGLDGRSLVTYAFKGFKAARTANEELWSPELTFCVLEHPSLSYSFKMNLRPNGFRGGVSLYWAPCVGSQPPGTLTWPIPHEKVKIALKILSFSAAGANGTKQSKLKHHVFGEAYCLTNLTPLGKDGSHGSRLGYSDFLRGAEFAQGGWTTGPDADILVVQAELILK